MFLKVDVSKEIEDCFCVWRIYFMRFKVVFKVKVVLSFCYMEGIFRVGLGF